MMPVRLQLQSRSAAGTAASTEEAPQTPGLLGKCAVGEESTLCLSASVRMSTEERGRQ